jgi:hypothetical protein
MTTSNKETQGKQHFKAIFSHYVAIKHQPHYVFTTEQALLVKCSDYPDMIGELNAYERVSLTAEIEGTCKAGVILKDVEWRLADE